MKQLLTIAFLISAASAFSQDTINYPVLGKARVKQSGATAKAMLKDPLDDFNKVKLSMAIKGPYLLEGARLNVVPLYKVFKPDEFNNKAVVLIFWDPGCKSCGDVFADLSIVLKQFSSMKDLLVVAVTPEHRQTASPKLAEKPLLYAEQIFSGGQIINAYQVSEFPAVVITDRQHFIKYAVTGSTPLTLAAFKTTLQTVLSPVN